MFNYIELWGRVPRGTGDRIAQRMIGELLSPMMQSCRHTVFMLDQSTIIFPSGTMVTLQQMPSQYLIHIYFGFDMWEAEAVVHAARSVNFSFDYEATVFVWW